MRRSGPVIAINWISLGWSLLDVRIGAWIAKLAGYDGLQGAPTRGLPADNIGRYLSRLSSILPILFLEDVWNPNSETWEDLDRQVFVDPKVAQVRMEALTANTAALKIDHNFGTAELVEAHPGMWLAPVEVLAMLRKHGAKLVLDTFHLRRRFMFGHQREIMPEGNLEAHMLQAWQDYRNILIVFAPYVRVVHVQPMRGTDELQRWLKGEPTELEDMLTTIRQKSPEVSAYVVELSPPSGLLAKIWWFLTIFWTVRAIQRKLRRITA